jgi:hypothetical protein
MSSRTLLIIFGAVLLAQQGAKSQSLGEVARKEAERRGVTATQGKVYSNDSLKPDPTAPRPAPATGLPADVAAAAPDAETKAAGSEAADGPVTTADGAQPAAAPTGAVRSERGEAYWRGRAQEVRSKMNLQSAEVLALRQRLTALPPDSSEYAVTQGAIKAAVHDLEAINNEWKRLEDLARSKNVPDAWIR